MARELPPPLHTTTKKRSWTSLCKPFRALLPSRQRSEKLDRLVAQYRILPWAAREAEANQKAKELIESVRRRAENHVPSWSEIDAVEIALLSMLSGEDLRRWGWTLRAQFERATSIVPADSGLQRAYQASNPPALANSDESALKADLLALQGQLQELRASRRTQLRARNVIAFWTVVLFATAILLTLQLDKLLHMKQTIIFDVFGVGMLGGVFSTLLRVQKFKLCGINEARALSQAGNQITVILAPAIGGVGAVVVFVMLAAGFLQGSFFPSLKPIDFTAGVDALEKLFQLQLASSSEAAKLYLLCFLAGFSERLVPDVMTRLSAMAEKDK
jgi:hypothetical protein